MYQKRPIRVHISPQNDSRALVRRFSFLLCDKYRRSLRQRTSIQIDFYLYEFPSASLLVCDEETAVHLTLPLGPLQKSSVRVFMQPVK